MINTIITKVVGVTFEGRQVPLSKITQNDKLFLQPEPDNKYDANAIQVIMNKTTLGCITLGYITRVLSKQLSHKIKASHPIEKFVLYGGGDKNFGLKILFYIDNET